LASPSSNLPALPKSNFTSVTFDLQEDRVRDRLRSLEIDNEIQTTANIIMLFLMFLLFILVVAVLLKPTELVKMYFRVK
jgi:hypothetical protein